MPYIRPILREELKDRTPRNPGELNYAITQLLIAYQETRGTSYLTINDIVGVLEAAKLEYYRRVAGPYENAKMAENGDIYS